MTSPVARLIFPLFNDFSAAVSFCTQNNFMPISYDFYNLTIGLYEDNHANILIEHCNEHAINYQLINLD